MNTFGSFVNCRESREYYNASSAQAPSSAVIPTSFTLIGLELCAEFEHTLLMAYLSFGSPAVNSTGNLETRN